MPPIDAPKTPEETAISWYNSFSFAEKRRSDQIPQLLSDLKDFDPLVKNHCNVLLDQNNKPKLNCE